MKLLQILLQFRATFLSCLFLWLLGKCAARNQPWALEQTGCDVERYVELGDVYTFDNFPPHPHPQQHPRPEYGSGAKSRLPNQNQNQRGHGPGPNECTWLFKAYDDCELELEVEGYSGDRDVVPLGCEEHYFLIGDEYSETRICGLGRPRPYFYSSGWELFLTQFRTRGYGNGYGYGYDYKLSGAVRCVRRKPAPMPTPPVCNSTCPGPPEPDMCDVIVINATCNSPGCCTVAGQLSSQHSSGKAQLSISATMATGNVCTLQSYSCIHAVLPNETVVPSLSPVQGYTTVCEEALVVNDDEFTSQSTAKFTFNGQTIDHSMTTGLFPPFHAGYQVGLCLAVGPP